MNDKEGTKYLVCNSPCVGHCCLDDLDICVGCERHIDEITLWHSASNQRKQEILNLCEQRRVQRKET